MNQRKLYQHCENLNKDFCDCLLQFAKFEKRSGCNRSKYLAYRKAICILSNYPKRIKSAQEVKSLIGIKYKIYHKLNQVIKYQRTNNLIMLQDEKKTNIVNLFTRISGIGPFKAKNLVNAGIFTLDELKKNQDLLTHHQRIGLKYLEDFEKKIPWGEIKEIEKIICKELQQLDSKFHMTICGSYRRGKQDNYDIDILLTHPGFLSTTRQKNNNGNHIKNVINALRDNGLITEVIFSGNTKFMGACKLEGPTRRIEIKLIPNDHYYCSILHYTGNDQFVKKLKSHAFNNKYALNEYSLRFIGPNAVPGPAITLSSEEEIFKYINYPYVKPEDRNI